MQRERVFSFNEILIRLSIRQRCSKVYLSAARAWFFIQLQASAGVFDVRGERRAQSPPRWTLARSFVLQRVCLLVCVSILGNEKGRQAWRSHWGASERTNLAWNPLKWALRPPRLLWEDEQPLSKLACNPQTPPPFLSPHNWFATLQHQYLTIEVDQVAIYNGGFLMYGVVLFTILQVGVAQEIINERLLIAKKLPKIFLPWFLWKQDNI